MTAARVPRLLIVAALGMEIAPLRRRGWAALPVISIRQWPLVRWRLPQGEIGAIATGVGPTICQEAVTAADAHWTPDAALAVGLAGATDETLRVGDVCLADTVMRRGHPDLSPHRATLALARSAIGEIPGISWHVGKALTVDEVVPTPAAKRALAAETSCQWVDMESAAVASMAQRLALPWLAVRAISDGVTDDLNRTLDIIDSHGRIPALAMLRAALAAPSRLSATLTLRRNARSASENLCNALAVLAPRMLSSIQTVRRSG